MKTAVIRKAHFNAAHQLLNPLWDTEKNKSVFGLCNNPNYHGHNYTLEVKIIGEVQPDTGFVMDLKKLKNLIDQEIIEKFDHKNLNLDLAEFKNLNPTAENIARVIYDCLVPHLEASQTLQIKLWETERNYVEFPA